MEYATAALIILVFISLITFILTMGESHTEVISLSAIILIISTSMLLSLIYDLNRNYTENRILKKHNVDLNITAYKVYLLNHEKDK